LGENLLIIHGILSAYRTFDTVIHEMSEFNGEKKVNWKKIRVFDNSKRGMSTAIYRERWI